MTFASTFSGFMFLFFFFHLLLFQFVLLTSLLLYFWIVFGSTTFFCLCYFLDCTLISFWITSVWCNQSATTQNNRQTTIEKEWIISSDEKITEKKVCRFRAFILFRSLSLLDSASILLSFFSRYLINSTLSWGDLSSIVLLFIFFWWTKKKNNSQSWCFIFSLSNECILCVCNRSEQRTQHTATIKRFIVFYNCTLNFFFSLEKICLSVMGVCVCVCAVLSSNREPWTIQKGWCSGEKRKNHWKTSRRKQKKKRNTC